MNEEEFQQDPFDFTFTNIGVVAQSSIHWFDSEKIKEKLREKMQAK